MKTALFPFPVILSGLLSLPKTQSETLQASDCFYWSHGHLQAPSEPEADEEIERPKPVSTGERASGNTAPLQIGSFLRQDLPPKSREWGPRKPLEFPVFQQAERLPAPRVSASRPSLQYPKLPPTSVQSLGTRGRIPPTTGRKSVMETCCVLCHKWPSSAGLRRFVWDVELPEFREFARSRWGCLSAIEELGRRFHWIRNVAPTP